MPLIHFTRNAEAVLNILTHGFAYVALPTKVADFVLPDIPSGIREPQQFGMISFRQEHEGEHSARHRTTYGHYGIVVDQEWALSAGAQPVLYLHRNGSVSHAMKRLLKKAAERIRHEESQFPGDAFRTMAYQNRNVAGVIGASEWANLLEVFQFLAPEIDEWEREWRIVNPLPNSSIPTVAREAIALVSPPQGWANDLNKIKLPPEALIRLIVPSNADANLRDRLPFHWHNIQFHTESG